MNFSFISTLLKRQIEKKKKILYLLSNLKYMRIPTEIGQKVQ